MNFCNAVCSIRFWSGVTRHWWIDTNVEVFVSHIPISFPWQWVLLSELSGFFAQTQISHTLLIISASPLAFSSNFDSIREKGGVVAVKSQSHKSKSQGFHQQPSRIGAKSSNSVHSKGSVQQCNIIEEHWRKKEIWNQSNRDYKMDKAGLMATSSGGRAKLNWLNRLSDTPMTYGDPEWPRVAFSGLGETGWGRWVGKSAQ